MIQEDMQVKRLYRSGLEISNIYEWYSSEIVYTKPEFTAKVLPLIQDYLDASPHFRKTLNRNGIQVWKWNA